jgi:hypothetical protein
MMNVAFRVLALQEFEQLAGRPAVRLVLPAIIDDRAFGCFHGKFADR